jgi:hypothetical protein
MENKKQRLILCAKDIMRITGKSERSARRIIAAIKKEDPSSNRLGITVIQFSIYSGIHETRISEFLR